MNKKHLLALILLLSAFLVDAQQATQSPRTVILFNFDWKFHFGDIESAYSSDFNDSEWRKLDIPHDFQFEQPWDQSAGGARGFKAMSIGWYRKSFKADASWKDKKVLIDFEGIMLTGEVWLNGSKIGGTDYGYVGFESDITKLIKYDGDNIIAVRASTGKTGSSRWYTGGGLFRDVNLVIKDKISIARHGVYITTPKITSNKANVKVQVEVEGIRGKRFDIDVKAAILDPNGNKIAETTTKTPHNSKLLAVEIPLPEIEINSPNLWSCESPYLYTAEVSLTQDGKVLDAVKERFGIRTIEFSKEFGFKLNGKKVFLKGISNHHDMGAVGAAAYRTAISRQMDLLKQFGYNHIRTSHNPYSKSFLELADEKGIIIVDELYDKWSNKDYWAGSKPWTDIWYENLIEWVKRDRNHASVVLWSLGNELQMREDLSGYPTGDWGVTTYRMMDVLLKRYDSTRKTTVAMFPARGGAIGKSDPEFNTRITPPELATVTEVASFNYRWMNYPDYLKHAPDMNIYQSEATTNELVAPFFGMDREKMVGLAYWGAIEYWGESHGWPRKGWNYSFFNHALEPFPQAYLIKSIFVDTPLVHIGVIDKENESLEWNDVIVGGMSVSSHWNRKEGSKQNVLTYTNADEVELFVNGKSFGVQKNNKEDIRGRNTILWQNIPYKKGKIKAIARNNGKEVTSHELTTTGKAVGLKIVLENQNWKADGMDLQYAKVYAVDSKGQVVPTTTGEVTFDVSGSAKLIAVDNGNHIDDDLFNGNKRKLHNGFALAILRSSRSAGEVTLKASVNGLKSAVKKLNTK